MYSTNEREVDTMIEKCYAVYMSTDLESLFEELDDYGLDYECEKCIYSPDYYEITVWCYPHEVADIEDIFAPYV